MGGGGGGDTHSYVDKDTNKYLFLPWKKWKWCIDNFHILLLSRGSLTGLTSPIFPWQNDKIKTVRTGPGLSRCDYQVLSSFVWRLNNWPSKYWNVGYFTLVQILLSHHCRVQSITARVIRSHISAQLIVFPDQVFSPLALASSGFCEHFFTGESALSETSVLYFYLWNSPCFTPNCLCHFGPDPINSVYNITML